MRIHSKIELGERQVNIDMIKGLSELLAIGFRELQVKNFSEKCYSITQIILYLKKL